MPELPEVETVRRGLEQKLNNFIIKKVEVCRNSTVAFPTQKEEFIKGLGSLGPEPFSKDFDANYLKKVISKRTKSIKAILLDQTIVAGIGNIYADESLYSAGISPFREARKIKKNELIKLKKSIVTVLKKSIGSGGTTFSDFRDLEGENGNFGLQTNVYLSLIHI